ncbi:DUF1553 domain-containing protein [Tunicatimonas pelagia]|uniref:DUF1553 domain-containing protein n=1 Tax=Tunicatimonas pelagia TaxID=931531 RepID=UPI002666F9CC|nr:DUF1553 domain-containing protein [Tunicatimonas pelagia]WKN41215.1 DUF1553 domain-containing protein [Tunicatimonas pelagia]
MIRNLILFLLISLLWSCSQSGNLDPEIAEQLPEEVSYNFHVKPILSDRCFACHGPDEAAIEAGLSLSDETLAFAKLESGEHAIVPGKPHQSGLVDRIFSDDPETVMPPPESNLTLTEYEKAVLTRWIEEGAEYEPHWSFIKPEKPEVPKVQQEDWANNDIDRFVLAKLEEKGFEPSDRATKEKLIRRVTFDLTGLPPTIEEVDKFLADNSSDAYEKVVDRLLNSPRYGERMATEWLDVARYADSHGYQDDGMRNMWPWRDWVIESFNQNMPYDQFIIWQLAGDMLPDATQEQKLASGFNRNHLQSQEGGIVSEEYRVEYVADRANTLGTAFLGLTVECSRCHDHKYDPISQEEYFSLYAFFNSINETGQIPYMGEASPTVILTDDEAEQQLSFLEEKILEKEAEVNPDQTAYQQGFAEWLTQVKNHAADHTISLKSRIGHYPLDNPVDNKFRNLAAPKQPATMVVSQQDKEPEIVDGKFGKAVRLVGDSYVDMGEEIGYFERNEPFSISLWYKALKDSIEGPVFTRSGGYFNGNRGYVFWLRPDRTLSVSLNHTWPANSIEIHTEERLPVNEWVHLVMTYDGSSRASGLTVYLNGQPMRHQIVTDHLRRSMITYGKDKESWGGLGNLRIGKLHDETIEGIEVDEFQVFGQKLSAVGVAELYGEPNPIVKFLESEDQQPLLDYYLQNYDQGYRTTLAKLTELRGDENDILSALPEVMVMKELAEPRPTFVLDRGAYDAPTKRVNPTTPVSVMAFPEDLPTNRLGLAQWLVHEDNPLTARVAVNRYWQMLFGRGLVNTSNDFGNQGEFPSHPELLDWLAIQFWESGWDVKALLRMLVTSATYQQASVPSPELLEQDKANVWLARGPSYRMPAEMIRDNALAASGLLNDSIGGPSVKPYQPPGLWKELATRNVTEYVPDTGDDLYRRGMYTIWKRSSPPPSMISFDAADKYLCTVKRQKTNTPLQALVLLNDPQYVEAARMLAERMVTEGGEDLDDQIRFGFKTLTSREPDSRELALLKQLYQEEKAVFSEEPVSADSLLQVGEYPRDFAIPKDQLAALTIVANTLVNYDEAVYKR